MKKQTNYFKKIKISIFTIFKIQKMFLILLTAISSYFFVLSAFAINPSGDILQNAQTDIQANFGTSSTIMYIVYTCEIFAGIGAYIKTKNLFSLMGLVVVVIFTSVAFGLV